MSKIINMLFFFYLITLLISAINTQLTLLSPHSLSSLFINNTIDIEYGKVGPLTDFYIRGQIILDTISPAREACSPLTGINLRKSNNTLYDENFKILLSYKGSCPISQKARNAQNAGASMLILIDKENTILNSEIFQETGDDITIPVTFIRNKDGKILEEYILNNPNDNIIAEINFKPKQKKFVQFKFFFSSSEPKAYELIGNMTKYIDKFNEQVIFTPHYVVHKNPYYVEENPNSNINCVSKGVYCYFPKETTITQEGQKILLENIRQKCMFEESKYNDITQYFKYLSTFAKLCVNTEKKSLTKQCSKLTLKELGYAENYLDECLAISFGVRQNNLDENYIIDKNNRLLESEYNEILKYKLTSFPAVVINDVTLHGTIKEESIIGYLCSNVRDKPDFCGLYSMFDKRKKSAPNKLLIYFLMFLLVVVNISLFFMCRAYILERINDRVNSGNIDIDSRINNVINNYFALKSSSNDYKAFDNNNNSSKVIEMREGSVGTI
jgi:hypothetical protein